MGNHCKPIPVRPGGGSAPFLPLLALLVPLFLLPSCKSGTPEPAPESDSSFQVVPLEEMETYTVLHAMGDCVVTYYDVCVLCCGKDDGITASGTAAAPYETCAVDPAVIPLGSNVVVKYGDGTLLRLRAEDTGKGVRGNHIDVCVAGHEEARALGVRWAAVYWEE